MHGAPGDAAAPPDAAVLAAFGVADIAPVRLVGGRGVTWRAGPVVLRPHDGAAVTDWRAAVLDGLDETPAFRMPRPVRTTTGAWRAGEWEAWAWAPGRPDPSRVEAVVDAGRAFHDAIAGLRRPAFLEDPSELLDDAWSRADRMAWGDEPLPSDPTLDRLARAFRPVATPSQLVHGDLLGNVLFADDAPPTIIDWPPYWRPAGTGEAVAVVDAVCWQGVPTSALVPLGHGTPEWPQLLVRALAFRIATLHVLGAWDDLAVARHAAVVEAVAPV
ncbi:aminoglycoside phosphotransferase [Curtobacterium sp. B8]|uniref:aminoglycoside phosphotransferase n=1 Tax=Curtobacterium sp. B8 TaxID=95611 RepID=UPI0003B43072|nr:aminoglycoside phosphotransferase [Curtobacterium sp. B8]